VKIASVLQYRGVDLKWSVPPADINFLLHLCTQIDARRIVEVGVYCGGTTSLLARTFPKSTVWAVDTFCGSGDPDVTDDDDFFDRVLLGLGADLGADLYDAIRSEFQNNCEQFLSSGRIQVIESDSYDAGIAWDQGEVDLVFIDANHSYQSVAGDIEAWSPHVRKGGILCGHDYGTNLFPGVTQAVDEIGADQVRGSVWAKRI
jgi:predicted O-methyltransferase YrrM